MDLCSLPGIFSGPYAQNKVPDQNFEMELNTMPVDDRTLEIPFPHFDTDIPQSRELVVARMRVEAHD
jgi:hypothetical protein